MWSAPAHEYLDADRTGLGSNKNNRCDTRKHVTNVCGHCDRSSSAALADSRRGKSKQLRSRSVGFNPFRQQEKTRTDLIVVITFLVITLAVVLWAFVGG